MDSMTDGLLLLHGWPLDGWMWEDQVAALHDEVPVLAPNLPGFGGAPSAGPVMSMDDAAEAAATALSGAGIDRAVVCGLSMGGYAALAFWRRYRARVAGLVFANTRAGADDEAGVERRRALAARLREEGSDFLVQSPPPLLSERAGGGLWDVVKANIRSQPAESIAAASLGMAERPDSTPDLPGIDVPTLVVTSSGDTLIPAEATRPMAEAIPGALLEDLGPAGHLSNLEAPEAFNRLLHDHLRRCGLLSP
jgi:pimeloyl-ACP methyl ester carboxylesterase